MDPTIDTTTATLTFSEGGPSGALSGKIVFRPGARIMVSLKRDGFRPVRNAPLPVVADVLVREQLQYLLQLVEEAADQGVRPLLYPANPGEA